jgi:hypothetical protein
MKDQIIEIIDRNQGDSFHAAEEIESKVMYWKRFPEEKPDKDHEIYLVWKNRTWEEDSWVKGRWYHTTNQDAVKAFMEIKPYKP